MWEDGSLHRNNPSLSQVPDYSLTIYAAEVSQHINCDQQKIT